MNSHFVRSVALSAGLLSQILAVAGCASRDDSASTAPRVALPDDTDETTFVRASPDATAKVGVAYWGATPDADRNASTVVGYGEKQEPIVNLRYEISQDFALDLSGPGIAARVRFSMTPDPSAAGGAPPADQASATGMTDAAVQLYDQIVGDFGRAAGDDGNDDEGALMGANPAVLGTHPTATLVPYSKDLLNKCWSELIPCRTTARALITNYQKLLLDPNSCNGAWKHLDNCRQLSDQSCLNERKWLSSSNGATCGDGLTQQRAATRAQLSKCETQRVNCLKQGTAPSSPIPSGICSNIHSVGQCA